ncbi:MAG: hypothetical protein ABI361_02070 [Nitrososphaera sp.]|jgi:hypothetical protein
MANSITIDKNSGSTVYTIRNFYDLTVDLNTPADVVASIQDNEDKAILIKILGATMNITLTYNIQDEASSVVTGTGSPVSTAIDQFLYLFSTLESIDVRDNYTFTFDFGGGKTFVKNGLIGKITPVMTSDAPITFRCTMQFVVGTNPS